VEKCLLLKKIDRNTKRRRGRFCQNYRGGTIAKEGCFKNWKLWGEGGNLNSQALDLLRKKDRGSGHSSQKKGNCRKRKAFATKNHQRG